MVPVAGGVLIVDGGEIIGAVGVSGGTRMRMRPAPSRASKLPD